MPVAMPETLHLQHTRVPFRDRIAVSSLPLIFPPTSWCCTPQLGRCQPVPLPCQHLGRPRARPYLLETCPGWSYWRKAARCDSQEHMKETRAPSPGAITASQQLSLRFLLPARCIAVQHLPAGRQSPLSGADLLSSCCHRGSCCCSSPRRPWEAGAWRPDPRPGLPPFQHVLSGLGPVPPGLLLSCCTQPSSGLPTY